MSSKTQTLVSSPTGLLLLGTLMALVVAGCGDDLPPAPDNTPSTQADLYFTESNDADSAWITSVRADGTGRRFVQNGVLTTAPRNGRMLWMEEDEIATILWLMNTDGSRTALAASQAGAPNSPRLNLNGTAISPVGNRIAYTASSNVGTIRYVYSVEANGSNRIVIADDAAHDTRVSISPDGQRVAYYRQSPDNDLRHGSVVIRSIYGGPAVQVVDDSASPNWDGFSWLEWSPDGNRVAYVGYENGVRNIFVASADGSDRTNVSNESQGGAHWPVWSPDGSQIAYVGGLDADIIVVDPSGGNKRNLTSGFNEGTALYPQWSPDGRKIAYTAYDGDPEKMPGRVKILDLATRVPLTVPSSAYMAFWRR